LLGENMGKMKTKNPKLKGKLRILSKERATKDKNKAYSLPISRSGIKKYIPMRKNK